MEKRGGEQERRGGLDDAKSIFFSGLVFLFFFSDFSFEHEILLVNYWAHPYLRFG